MLFVVWFGFVISGQAVRGGHCLSGRCTFVPFHGKHPPKMFNLTQFPFLLASLHTDWNC